MGRLWICLLVVGCAKGPQSGTWVFDTASIAVDSCDVTTESQLPDGEFFLYNQGDGTMVIDPNDGTDVFDCTIDKDTFDCPARLEDSQTQGDNTISVMVGVQGDFSDRETASGSQNGEITCDGPQCELAEQQTGQEFPCQIQLDFSATFSSDALP